MLEPEIDFTEAEDTIEETYDQGYQTYKLDLETGEISRELITGIEAVKQFAALALRTPRFEHAIYSDQFGSELLDLIKDREEVTQAFLSSEIERLVIEALIYDDRIDNVTDFEIEFKDDEAHIKFLITAMDDVIEIGEVLTLDV